MHVRALGRIPLVSCGTFGNFDLKVHRQLLGGIASSSIASLVFQLTVKGIFCRNHVR